jgi:hypothetical protein
VLPELRRRSFRAAEAWRHSLGRHPWPLAVVAFLVWFLWGIMLSGELFGSFCVSNAEGYCSKQDDLGVYSASRFLLFLFGCWAVTALTNLRARRRAKVRKGQLDVVMAGREVPGAGAISQEVLDPSADEPRLRWAAQFLVLFAAWLVGFSLLLASRPADLRDSTLWFRVLTPMVCGFLGWRIVRAARRLRAAADRLFDEHEERLARSLEGRRPDPWSVTYKPWGAGPAVPPPVRAPSDR